MDRVAAAFRKFQQTYYYHALLAAVAAAFTAALRAYSSPDASTASVLSTAAGTMVFTFCVSIQHSPGSSDFHPDGTPNVAVANVVAVQKRVEAEPENQQAVAAVQRVSTVASIEAARSK
jgi:hypothetical protein